MEENDRDRVKTTRRQQNDKEEEEEEEEEEKGLEIWSWGAGTDGQLGTGGLQDCLVPQLLRLPSSVAAVAPISRLSCGGAHVLALTSGGKVLSWGRGGSGQLGHGEAVSTCPTPKLLTLLESFFITHASAGWNHSGFVSDTGSVFTCGDGSFGQLGHGDNRSLCSPVEVSFFVDKLAEHVACGTRHSLVLLKGQPGDQVYAFGSGKRGQLGISKGKINSINLPQSTLGLEGVEIVRVASNGDHSAALSSDGNLFSWGRGFAGNSNTPLPMYLPSPSRFIEVALGWNHALLLTGDGEAFMLGGDHHGVLSDPEKLISSKNSVGKGSKEGVLQEIPGVVGQKVVDISAGAEHSALVTEDGAVKTWGWGEHGQLGLGDTDDQMFPREVSLLGHRLPSEGSDTKVYCGSGFTIAVRTSNAASPG